MKTEICGWPIPATGGFSAFPAPFAQQGDQSADLVLGQSSFTNKDQSATAQTMNTPYGLALFPDGRMAVSDAVIQSRPDIQQAVHDRRSRNECRRAADFRVHREPPIRWPA